MHTHVCAGCGVKWPHDVKFGECQWPNPWFCPDCEWNATLEKRFPSEVE